MNKHTPGPWELETHYDHNNDTHLNLYGHIDTYLHKPIARLYPDCRFADDSDKANAYLIAAAPDLLAALEAVAALDDGMLTTPALQAVHQARAAIAKAKGEV